jgi:hypothetical protein
LLNFVPDLARRLFEAIKKAETANVKLVWEDADVIAKFSVVHKPYHTSTVGARKRR